MQISPIGHIGIPLPVAHVLRLSLPVVLLCSLSPDLVDKPLWALGIGGPRYIAHTVLFVLLVSVAFFLWKRVYGLSALFGGASHLLLDWFDQGFPVPWLYPFVSYDFPEREFDPSGFFPNLLDSLERYVTLSRGGGELIWVAVAGVAAFLLLRLYHWHSKRRTQR